MNMEVTLPYSGELLVTHLAAYGLALVLHDAGVPTTVAHSDSLTFEPCIRFEADVEFVADAVRQSAVEAEAAVEADIEPGKTGNDRRSLIWARASRDSATAAEILRRRDALLVDAEERSHSIVCAILAGIGATAAWVPEKVKPQSGSTALDGVLGNNTSDLIRGVLRPGRRAAEAVDAEVLKRLWRGETDDQLDKTGWAPPGTRIDLVHQWLAVIGLGMLPVAHRRFKRSATPATWRRDEGVTLPILGPTTPARLLAILKLAALSKLDDTQTGPAIERARAELRALGINEVVQFRRHRTGSKSSVAFIFGRGVRVDLRERA